MKIVKLLLFLSIPFNVTGQDTIRFKNAITVNLLSFIDNTISLTYYKQVGKQIEISINPRVRIAKNNPGNFFTSGIQGDPWWHYDRFTIRSGFLVNIDGFFLQPLFQYDYGSFDKRRIQTEDHEGDLYDEYQDVSQRYHSTGFIGLLGYIKDGEIARTKIYIGLGNHAKSYTRTTYALYQFYDRTTVYDPPLITNSKKSVASFHIGVEIGVHF